MTKLLLIIILSFFLQACSHPHPNHIDPAFAPMYIQFQHDAAAMSVHFDADRSLTIQFASLGYNPNATQSEMVGECQSQPDNHGYNNIISIDPVFWARANTTDQWILVYHELGHCVLGAGHTANPADIMYPQIGGLNSSVWANDHLSSVHELFLPHIGMSL